VPDGPPGSCEHSAFNCVAKLSTGVLVAGNDTGQPELDVVGAGSVPAPVVPGEPPASFAATSPTVEPRLPWSVIPAAPGEIAEGLLRPEGLETRWEVGPGDGAPLLAS
jgi:hypothetical protein